MSAPTDRCIEVEVTCDLRHLSITARTPSQYVVIDRDDYPGAVPWHVIDGVIYRAQRLAEVLDLPVVYNKLDIERRAHRLAEERIGATR